MKKNTKGKKEQAIQNLIDLFNGDLCISNRNYYENLDRLENLISNYKIEVKRNIVEIAPKSRNQYYVLHREILENIKIPYAQTILDHKISKYDLKEEDFPLFNNEQFIQLMERKPSEESAKLVDSSLSRYGLILQMQEAFFRYWMRNQKEALEKWLNNQGNNVSAASLQEEDLNEDGLTLNQQILVASLDGRLTAAEEFYGKNLVQALSQFWKRPANKIAECLKKLNGLAKDLENSAAYKKDTEVAQAFLKRFGML